MNAGWAVILMMTGTAMTAQDVAGHYVLRGVQEVGSELLLRPNGQFEYMLAYGAADYSAKGSWKMQDGAVVLTTTAPEAQPFRLVKSERSEEQAARVWVLGPGGQAVPNIDVAMKVDGAMKRARTDSHGAAAFPPAGKSREVMFSIPVYQLEAGPFALDASRNEYYFEINGEAITTVRFKEEKVAVDGQALVLRFWNRDRPMRYERQ